jgi:hypothetical protein
MRIYEITTPTDKEIKGNTAPLLTIQSIAKYIQAGNWPKAIAMGAITLAPQLDPLLTADQKRVLHYAVNTYGAVNFWSGLSVFASRIGVPFLALAGWSDKLNKGEEDDLKARRIAQASQDFAP